MSGGFVAAALATLASLRPNVLVFYADDVGIGDVGTSGLASTRVRTPNVDALAANGVHLTRFLAPAAALKTVI